MAQARMVTVEQVQGVHGPRWQVTGSNGSLLTADCKAGSWAQVEQHVRHGMGQPTPMEQWAQQMHALVEQHGVEHPVGSAAYAALIECGME